jgi:hypothetical protein
MTLTVPRSNASAGRAARTVPIEADTTGASLANLGDTMLAVGTAVEADRLDRQMQRLQVDMTQDLNQLRLEAEKIGDPDAAEAAWAGGVERIRDGYSQPGEDGRPRLDPKNAERFGIAFDDLAARHSFSLGRRTLELKYAQRQAQYMAYSHAAMQTYASGDDEMRLEVLTDLDAMVDADLTAGRIDAAEAQRRKMEFRADGDNARAIHMISADPDGFLQARQAGGFAGLPASVLARYEVQAEGAIARREKAAAEAEQKAQAARSKEIGNRLDEIGSIADDGRVAVDEAFLSNPEVQSHPKFSETRAKISLRDEGVDLSSMTPAEIRAQIQAERGRKVTHAWETERLKVLEAALEQHESGYEADAVGYALELGRDVPELPEFDPSTPEVFAEALRDRMEWSAGEVEQGFTRRPIVLSNAERQTLQATAGKDVDPDQRLALAQSLASGLGRDAGAQVAASLGKDSVFAWVTDLTARGVDPSVARDILDGESKMAGDLVKAPSRSVAIELFEDATGGDFRDLNSLSAAVLDAALAIYAVENPTEDPKSIDAAKFEAALNRALGASSDGAGGIATFDTQGTWGGLRGRSDNFNVVLPVGVHARDVSVGLEVILEDLTPGRKKVTAAETPYDDSQVRELPVNFDRLNALSLSGAPADFGDPDADGYDPAGLFGQLRFAPVWADGRPQDVYVLYRQNGVSGRQQPLRDVNGKPFTISLQQLVRATK